MNPLERSLIEKAGYANGWENVRESTPQRAVLFSARHKAEAHILRPFTHGGPWQVTFPNGPPAAELARSLPDMQRLESGFEARGEGALGKLLRRAAELAMSLPNHAAKIYAEEIAKIEAQPPTATEAMRLVKQRIGQNVFRQALIDYWGGACAVTGLDLPEALRASHANPGPNAIPTPSASTSSTASFCPPTWTPFLIKASSASATTVWRFSPAG